MNWFFSSGDAPFFFSEQLTSFSFFPDLWRENEGFGISSLPALWIDYPFRFITSLLSRLGFSWFVIDKLWWLLVFVTAIYGSYKLAKHLGLSPSFSWLSSVIYASNTYILLLFDGGQLGVALAYSFIPWVLRAVLTFFAKRKPNIQETIQTGLYLSVLLFLDLRIAYVFFVMLIPVFVILYIKKQLRIPKETILLPLIIVAVNMFWILPTVLYKDSLNAIYSQNTGGQIDLSFFSVADFPHALSLLHPNYPENLFGRVYFFKPEFLLIPLLAFSVFLWKKNTLWILIFGFIALLGGFLGKGVNEPFGSVYEFFYRYVPGFFLFRDPTKWYVLTAVAYSVVIPFFISRFSGPIKKIIVMFFLIVWLFTLRYVFLGAVSGNITPPQITDDYQALKTFMMERQSAGGTLWLPQVERFGYADQLHPAFSATTLLSESSPAGIARLLQLPETLASIAAAGVSYVVIPDDIEQRQFLDDYQYKEELRSNLIAILDANPIVQKVPGFKRLAIYTIPHAVSQFQVNNQPIAAAPGDDRWTLFLPKYSEERVLHTLVTYDPSWRLSIGTDVIKPENTEKNTLSFLLPVTSASQASLIYLPTIAARYGTIISFGMIVFFVGLLLIPRSKQ